MKRYLTAILMFPALLLAGCAGSVLPSGGSEAATCESSRAPEESDETLPLVTVEIPAEPLQEKIVFRFAGDFTQAEYWKPGKKAPIMEKFDEDYGGDITAVFSKDLLELTRSADVFMLNNEFPYTDSDTPRENKKWTYKADPARVRNLTALGVDLVGLANNHVTDWGMESLLDTLDTLEAEGIPYVGAGRDLEEAGRIQYFTVAGRTFSIVAASEIELYGGDNYGLTVHATDTSPGIFYTYPGGEETCALIREARAGSDYCFVYIHWGLEKTTELSESQRTLSKNFIDAGADAVIGSHPHWVQGIDYYRGKPIFYSLGNYWFNMHDLDSVLLEFTFDTATLETDIRWIPCRQYEGRTVAVTKEDKKAERLDYIRSLSENARIDGEGYVTEGESIAVSGS